MNVGRPQSNTYPQVLFLAVLEFFSSFQHPMGSLRQAAMIGVKRVQSHCLHTYRHVRGIDIHLQKVDIWVLPGERLVHAGNDLAWATPLHEGMAPNKLAYISKFCTRTFVKDYTARASLVPEHKNPLRSASARSVDITNMGVQIFIGKAGNTFYTQIAMPKHTTLPSAFAVKMRASQSALVLM